MILILPLLAAMAPFLIWPIELFLPYPHIIEELAKAFLVFPLLDYPDRTTQIKLATLFGFLFALSENVLYIFNFSLVGNLGTFFARLLVTAPLHMITFFLILVPAIKSKKLVPLGVIAAILVHYLYNSIINNIIS